MKIHPYIHFDTQSEEAFRFYAKALGGKMSEIHRFGSMPPQGGFELTPEQKNLVMHVRLELPDDHGERHDRGHGPRTHRGK